ncbi:MAG TPA: hypothetical protein VLI05_00320 [Candidatus Saccharimonadia bacterium]|nr:hypothetical protein [Candidatus Saccharimonadia bacterium]
MINATLATTNGLEPWAANVDFSIEGTNWSTTLNPAYLHYKNLVSNPRVVIVYKASDHEIIARGLAEMPYESAAKPSRITINTTWLRLVENGKIQDYDSKSDIYEVLKNTLLQSN